MKVFDKDTYVDPCPLGQCSSLHAVLHGSLYMLFLYLFESIEHAGRRKNEV